MKTRNKHIILGGGILYGLLMIAGAAWHLIIPIGIITFMFIIIDKP